MNQNLILCLVFYGFTAVLIIPLFLIAYAVESIPSMKTFWARCTLACFIWPIFVIGYILYCLYRLPMAVVNFIRDVVGNRK